MTPTLSRRDFVTSSALTGLAALASQPLLHSTHHAPRTTPFELDEATIAGLQDGMRTGKYTARRLCELYLTRIDAIDRRGPTLRAVIEPNPDALAIAAQRDQERNTGKIR